MHDTAAIQTLCNEIEEIAFEYGARSVVRVALEIRKSHHFTPEHMRETFQFFRGASPLLRDTELEFLYSDTLDDDEMILRDVELDLPDQDRE